MKAPSIKASGTRLNDIIISISQQTQQTYPKNKNNAILLWIFIYPNKAESLFFLSLLMRLPKLLQLLLGNILEIFHTKQQAKSQF
jgi:hypothetical protein